MAQNIEIKARLRDRRRVLTALADLKADGPTELRQVDVFFNTPAGRLKLRTINESAAELIYYDRPDRPGPKASDYVVVPTAEPVLLRDALGRAYGERAVVEKVRTLYLIGPTRVHLDAVKGLGDFLELEVVLRSADEATAGHATAENICSPASASANRTCFPVRTSTWPVLQWDDPCVFRCSSRQRPIPPWRHPPSKPAHGRLRL